MQLPPLYKAFKQGNRESNSGGSLPEKRNLAKRGKKSELIIEFNWCSSNFAINII